MSEHHDQVRQIIKKNLETKNPYLELGNCYINDLNDFPELFECTHLETLILSNEWRNFERGGMNYSKNQGYFNNISFIPHQITNLINLSTLIIAGDMSSEVGIEWKIKDIDFVSELQKLTTLDASYNEISTVRFSEVNKNLKFLALRANPISVINSLENLKALECLILESNPISNTDFLEKLVNLRFLTLSSIPISNYNILQKLNHLKELTLTYNEISDIQFLSEIKGLQYLDLGINKISDISTLESLPGLEFLRLYSNNISDVSHLNKLDKLKLLDVAANPIDSLRFPYKLSNLQTLNVSFCKISNISFLEKLSELQTLNLSNNKISDIKYLKALNKLKTLFLSDNQISDIRYFENLMGLEHLSLTSNQITDLSHLKNNINLTRLDLHSNQITAIEPLENLIELQELYLAYNQITNIKPLERLKKLKYIDISENQITDISMLGALPELRYLRIRNNLVREIPQSIFMLNIEFEGDDLFNNPIISPPLEVIYEGRQRVLEYFKQIEKEGGSKNIYEAKLTLVGEGGAGKTSLQLRLLNPSAELPRAETRTRGVEITDWNISASTDRKEIIHIWDFGGQDMYFPVHRFFLTENSVYVLMASSRNRAHNFEYWIPSIYQFGGDSPILIAQTKHEGHHEPWLSSLKPFFEKAEFKIDRTPKDNYYKLNLFNNLNEGLEEIKSSIINQVRGLPRFGRPVPPSFIKLRNVLLKEMNTSPCMTFEQYSKFCGQVDSEFNNEGILNLFSSTMYEIGALLWYGRNPELKNWVILKPEWLMKAVYALIDDQQIEKQNGNIYQADFERLWSDPAYKHHHHVLKKMLEEFKIAFPKKHIKHGYLLPARQLTVPSKGKWVLSNQLLRLWIKFNFMPKGIVNQISADLSRLVNDDTDAWNSGVILTDTLHNSECLVIEEIFEKRISVMARGPEARSLNILVLQSLQNIIEDYRGVELDLEVPCRCIKCSENEKPYTIYKYT
ncbi:MAG TPA: leucine-rich repeat domain-containing protein, partial [Bacteroidia bacterium]|nr:leucine-rich repeat domain-containing protein [Bacteroidia bacterium]